MGIQKGTKLTDNPRDKRIGIRLTEEQSNELNECCVALGISKTDVIVKGIGLVKEQIKKK